MFKIKLLLLNCLNLNYCLFKIIIYLSSLVDPEGRDA